MQTSPSEIQKVEFFCDYLVLVKLALATGLVAIFFFFDGFID